MRLATYYGAILVILVRISTSAVQPRALSTVLIFLTSQNACRVCTTQKNPRILSAVEGLKFIKGIPPPVTEW